MGIIAGLLSMLGWGTSDFLAAKSSRKIGFTLTLFWTQTVSFLIALIYFFVNFQILNIANIPKFIISLAISGFLYMIATLAFYKGLKEGQVSLVSPIGASWVMITIILSVIFLKEVLQTNQIIAIILIILGIVLVSADVGGILRIKKLTSFAGIKEGLIAMFGWGLSLFLVIPASKGLGWFLPVFLLRLFTILFLASYILFSKQSFKINFQPPLLALILPIGLLDMIAFFAYSFGVGGGYTSIVAPIAASFPIVTIILARIFFKEKFILTQVFGIVSVIIGLILISI